MFFKRLYDPDLAQASYMIGCQQNGTAIVVDPVRDITRYLDLAKQEGLKVVAVTETHIHADYLSGSRELATHTGAKLYLSDEGGGDWSYAFEHESLRDGSEIRLGNITLKAVHTPGHTPEHLSFLVTDGARTSEPVIFLTGDFVFVGDLGRPDLLDEAAGGVGTRFTGAQQLFDSLKTKFLTLPDYVQVWPGHGSGSACGKALGAVESTTVGYEKNFAWWADLLEEHDLEGFTTALLEGQPDAPLYYGRMKRQNQAGPALLGKMRSLEPLGGEQLQHALERGARLIDTRPRNEYQDAAVPGSIHLPAGKTFGTWAGWLLNPEKEYVLFARNAEQAEQLRHGLWMTGIDNVSGFISSFEGLLLEPQSATPVGELGDLGDTFVLDVRAKSEYAAGHIEGATQLHAGRLTHDLDRIPRDRPVIVHCQGGARSAAAVSVLRAEGFQNILDLEGGYAAYAQLNQARL
ncbi:MBL fold metallo-hydrolase [Deinococcus peraridilitoris]|uniref:Zn-dependent hydrolase, glyoxylase n=1 Tax=Deinococcus peraridilitoris (strain DSM 19664 / LMG 22246 / CIP 109416 / KR-200) TaxID=937777 RepID=L0A0D3_DEIPD|nr:MBL fold metallo-hydrolase [Deinococcus peraridilitoris]AFZ66607.1 Zn-dependent hydrolase, glyoxylase [Deinococcus peraridilitoris DSM 19664]